MRKRTPCARRAVIGFSILAVAAGCSSSSTRPAESPAASRRPIRCPHGTLGIEAGPISRKLRSQLSLPAGVGGAVVVDVLPGGPGAFAGIRKNDVIVEVGEARIANDCDFVDHAYGRSCDPVRVVVRRGEGTVEATLTPVDQDALFEKACLDGSSSACFRRAWSLWAQAHGADAKDRALELYAAACRAGSAEACAYGGLHLAERKERAKDAVETLQRACDLGSAAGCAHLAFLHATGKIVSKDDRRATTLYVKSCELGDARGCYNAGLMMEEGRGVAKDLVQAAAKYAEACEDGSSTACTNLGFLYERGRGVKKDEARAAALYRQGCDGTSCQPPNLAGCVNLGRAFRDGIGVEKNPARAAPIFDDACQSKIDSDDLHAEENQSHACSLLGALYLYGTGVGKDTTKARELSELGCGRGDAFGCFNAAVIHGSGVGTPPDPVQEAAFFEKACRADDGEGCYEAGKAYEKGEGVARDRKRAGELFTKGCELGFEKACARKPAKGR